MKMGCQLFLFALQVMIHNTLGIIPYETGNDSVIQIPVTFSFYIVCIYAHNILIMLFMINSPSPTSFMNPTLRRPTSFMVLVQTFYFYFTIQKLQKIEMNFINVLLLHPINYHNPKQSTCPPRSPPTLLSWSTSRYLRSVSRSPCSPPSSPNSKSLAFGSLKT